MIDILLASYNGEKYIAEQIESILNQTYKDWFLYIKDDCSTDNTVNIINGYEERYKDKIKVILSDKATGSAKNNFFSMLQYSKSDYVMTCDQDDVWLLEKIEMTYNKMKEVEEKNNDIPILVHTDLRVVDEKLNNVADSLLKYLNLDGHRDKLNNLLVQNIVTGCTVMINRKLLNYIKLTPQKAIMHDWWMALVAASLGRIIFIETPTILYRQHENNSVGAKNVKSINYIFSILKKTKSIKKSINDSYLQSEEFLSIIGDDLDIDSFNMIRQYSLLYKSNKFSKLEITIKHSLWKKGIIKCIGQIIFC